MLSDAMKRLAVHGGPKVRETPWPPRRLFDEAEKQAVLDLFDAATASGEAFSYDGAPEQAYCRAFTAYMGGGYADAVSSGSAAVYVALRVLELEPFTEVIVPPVTDMGGVMPVPLCNCIPIVADTAPRSYLVGPEQIAERITDRTSAIIVAHIAGLVCDMDPIMEIARARGIPVIEDCAQAHGATYKGRPVGTFGDVAAFSTMSGKHHATGAQGGVVYTRREDLYWKSRRASDRGKPFGLEGEDTNVVCTLNFNSNDLASAIGLVQLKKLPAILEGRRQVARALAERCETLETIRIDLGLPDSDGAFWFLVFELDTDKVSCGVAAFAAALEAEGMPFFAQYTQPFTRHRWYRERAVFGSSGYPWSCPLYKGDPNREYPLPNMDDAHTRLFGLRIHENLTDADIEDAFAALRKAETAYMK